MSSNTSPLTTKIREISKSDTTTKEITVYIKSVCNKRSLDEEKVAEELLAAIERTEEIRNISGFVKGVLAKLDDRKFIKEKHVPIFTGLDKALVQNGIVGETWELFLIHAIETHCLNEFNVSAEDLIITNRAIVEFCKNNNIKTLSGFKSLLLRAKILKKCNIPLVVLEKEAKEHGNNYDKIIKDLEEDETLYGEAEND